MKPRASFRALLYFVLVAEAAMVLLVLWTCRVLLTTPRGGSVNSGDLWTIDGNSWWIGSAEHHGGTGPPMDVRPTVKPTQCYPLALASGGRSAELSWGEHRWLLGSVRTVQLEWKDEIPSTLDTPGLRFTAEESDSVHGRDPELGMAAAFRASGSPPRRTAMVVQRRLEWGNLGTVAAVAAAVGALAYAITLPWRYLAWLGTHSERMKAEVRCEGCGYSLRELPPNTSCPECAKPRD